MAALCGWRCPVFQGKTGQTAADTMPTHLKNGPFMRKNTLKTNNLRFFTKTLDIRPDGPIICPMAGPLRARPQPGDTLMTTLYINDGQPVAIYHGITSAALLARCADARRLGMPDAADAMAYTASMMDAAEPIAAAEWLAAEHALRAVERTLMDNYTGPVRLNKRGLIWAGHPALGYSQAPAQRQEVRP